MNMNCRKFLSYVHNLAQSSPKSEEDNTVIYCWISQQLENRHEVDQRIPVQFFKIVLGKLGNSKTSGGQRATYKRAHTKKNK